MSLFRFDDYVSVKIEITHRTGGTWRTKKDLKDGRYFAKVDAIAGLPLRGLEARAALGRGTAGEVEK